MFVSWILKACWLKKKIHSLLGFCSSELILRIVQGWSCCSVIKVRFVVCVALGDSLFIISQCFSFVNNFFQFFSNIFLSCFFHCFKCFCTTYPHLCVDFHIAAWMQSLHSFEYSKKTAAFSLYSHHVMHFLYEYHLIPVFASWSQHFSGSGYSTPSVSTVIFAIT